MSPNRRKTLIAATLLRALPPHAVVAYLRSASKSASLGASDANPPTPRYDMTHSAPPFPPAPPGSPVLPPRQDSPPAQSSRPAPSHCRDAARCAPLRRKPPRPPPPKPRSTYSSFLSSSLQKRPRTSYT